MQHPEQLIETLTEREQDVLRGIGQGLCNAEIAEQLTISPATVKWYTRQIYSKLQLVDDDHKRRTAADIARRANGNIPHGRVIKFPADITPFIGREDDLASLSEMLKRRFPRLITIMGLGGTGKTRLALQVARHIYKEYDGHVFFIRLKGVTDRKDLLQTIAHTIDCPRTARQDLLQSISLHLNNNPALLILDNAEHLVSIASIFVELLKEIFNLKLVITSRERLNLVSEYVYSLDGLSYPSDVTDTNLGSYDGIKYFVHIARRINPRWQPTHDEYRQIVTLCKLVGGLPLALQLAALQTARMSLADIVKSISLSNTVLTYSAPDLQENHHSIETMLDELYSSLTAHQQVSFSKLGLFISDFGREAAEAIADLTDDTSALFIRRGILEIIEPGRFNLHPLVQRFALKQLESSHSYQSAISQFVQYYSHFAASFGSQLLSGMTLNTFEREWSHVLAAWHYAVDNEDWSNLHRLLAPVHHLTWRRTYYHKGIAIFEVALKRAEQVEQAKSFSLELYVRLMHLRGYFDEMSDAEIERFEHAVNDLSYTRNWRGYAFGLIELATNYRRQGRLSLAYKQSSTAFTVYKTQNDKWGMAITSYQMGLAKSLLGDIQAAREHWQDSKKLNQTLDDRMLAGLLLHRMAQSEWIHGYADSALALIDEAKNQIADLQDRDMTAGIANLSSAIHFSQGNFEQAKRHREISLDYYQWISAFDVVCQLRTQGFYEAILVEDIATASAIIVELKLIEVDQSHFVDSAWDHLQFLKVQIVPDLDVLINRITWMQQMGLHLQKLLTATLALPTFVNTSRYARAVRLGAALYHSTYRPVWLMDLPTVKKSFNSALYHLGTPEFERHWHSITDANYATLLELTD